VTVYKNMFIEITDKLYTPYNHSQVLTRSDA